LGMGIQSPIPLRLWVEIIETGIIRVDELNRQLDKHSASSSPTSWPSWKRLWHFYDWDFSDGSDSQFSHDIDDVQEGLSEGRYKNPAEFMHVVGILLGMQDLGFLQRDAVTLVDDFKRYIDEHLLPSFDYPSYTAATWSFDSGFDGLGFFERDSVSFREVLSYLQLAAKAWKPKWIQSGLWEEMQSKLKNNIYEFLGDLKYVNGVHSQRFFDEPVLHFFPVSEFVDTWLSLPRASERIFPQAFRERYEARPVLLTEEGPWWQAVSDEVRSRSSALSGPRAVQVRLLADAVDKVIAPAA
ncbi:MAG: hypothetical protein U1E06_09690, partial [Tabrizicola sp.]|nr:hypothetical protein [Tabrizicola sp.]